MTEISIKGLQKKHPCLKIFPSADSQSRIHGSILAHFSQKNLIQIFAHSFPITYNGNSQVYVTESAKSNTICE